MIYLKTDKEIGIMKEGGVRLRGVVKKLLPFVTVGISTEEIDKEAERLICEQGGEASFKKVKGYNWTTCISINEQIVHTSPSKREVKTGDIVTIDIGMLYKGYNTDFATTFIVGDIKDNAVNKFLETGKTTLNKAIDQAKVGNRIGDISHCIESEIAKRGYGIVKELTGHGIGRDLHEDPFIPGFLEKPISKTVPIRNGLVIAIEIIYTMKGGHMKHEKNDTWSIVTSDGSKAACFEHTIAITNRGTEVLT